MSAPDLGPPATAVWRSRASELSQWAFARFVNRVDVFGGYLPLARRGKRVNALGVEENWEGPYTRPAKKDRGKVFLTRRVLARHFAATRPEDVVGTHTTSDKNTSVYGAVEIDWHGPESTAPEVNRAAALGWHRDLTAMGFRPLLTDSNGRGGFHLRVLLASAIPTPRVFWFLRRLVRDHGGRGLPNAPETFPKQSSVAPNKFGNWLRLPGRHHSREHWSRVWDGSDWVEGNEAIDFMLALDGDSPALIPEDIEWQHRIGEYMAKLPNKAEGQGRDDVAFNFLAFMVRDLQLEDSYALEWANRWDAGNTPPKGPERLREILANVHEYGRNGYGSGLNGAGGRHGPNGNGRTKAADDEKPRDDWPAPIPFDAPRDLPPFPTHLLPPVLRRWTEAVASATQTPPDLPASLALAVCGAALAGKVTVIVRDGWPEPTNLFTVVALPPGERKSQVHRRALVPVVAFELREQERMAPVIAAAASEHRQLEAQLKHLETKAAKAENSEDRQELSHEAKELAKELAKHVVPESPQLFCDDVTPEALGRLLAKQGGRMLQASPEGTAFEIVKGRYSESPNFDVYLKGHAGDSLRVGRIGRDSETVDQAFLSAALAVQPDVIAGLASQAILRGRGFLARWLYSLPTSKVGEREIAARPAPRVVEDGYHEAVTRLWQIEGAVEDGKPAAHLLHFSADADRRLQTFERWLEPQLAQGEELSLLAGWANKLAGAAARIAGILHVVQETSAGRPWYRPIDAATVDAAVQLARDYFLPHAQAAFAVMGADGKVEDARHAWDAIARRCAHAAHNADAPPPVSRRDIHNWNRRRFPTAEAMDPVLALLVDRYYIRPAGGGQPGRGHLSPRYEVNPMALSAFLNEAPRAHCAQRTHSNGEDAASAHNAYSAHAPSPPDGDAGQEAEGFTDPSYEPASNPFRNNEERI